MAKNTKGKFIEKINTEYSFLEVLRYTKEGEEFNKNPKILFEVKKKRGEFHFGA